MIREAFVPCKPKSREWNTKLTCRETLKNAAQRNTKRGLYNGVRRALCASLKPSREAYCVANGSFASGVCNVSHMRKRSFEKCLE
jgi:hypothetical protein